MGWIDRRRGGQLRELVDQLLDADERAGAHHYCPTGYHPLDEVLDGGLRTGDLTILGGRPGSGKTAMSLQWALAAASAGIPTIVASLEHDPSDVLERLLLIQVGAATAGRTYRSGDVRPVLARVLEGATSWDEATERFPVLGEAREAVDAAAGHLHLICGSSTSVDELAELAQQHGEGPKVVVVDYLQKVAAHSGGRDDDDVVRDAKSLALETGAAVLAISSMDQGGLDARRLTMSHLQGAEAITYEADLVLMLDSKLNTVSKLHTDYDDVRRREFAKWSVVTVDKNRRGPAGLGLEFLRDLGFSRFDPDGGIVSERLEEERGVTAV